MPERPPNQEHGAAYAFAAVLFDLYDCYGLPLPEPRPVLRLTSERPKETESGAPNGGIPQPQEEVAA